MRYLALAIPFLSGCLLYEERDPHGAANPVTKDQVISMTKSGVPESQIIQAINENGVDRKPTADDLVEMQNSGVSGRVMTGFVEAPVTPGGYTSTRYYYDPTPDLFHIGVGVLTGYLIYRHYRRH